MSKKAMTRTPDTTMPFQHPSAIAINVLMTVVLCAEVIYFMLPPTRQISSILTLAASVAFSAGLKVKNVSRHFVILLLKMVSNPDALD